MRMLVAGVLLLLLAALAQGQAGALKEIGPPEFVPLVASVPLQPGLVMDIEWVSLAGRVSGTLYRCTVETVDDNSVAYRAGRGNPLHTIDNRVDCEYYTGNWSESRDDQLPHTWPWISLLAAQQLNEGQPGETTVALGDLLGGEMREYLLAGVSTVLCSNEGQPVALPCWLLASGNGSTMSVLADPQNPVVVRSYEPGRSMQRALDIRGVDVEFALPE